MEIGSKRLMLLYFMDREEKVDWTIECLRSAITQPHSTCTASVHVIAYTYKHRSTSLFRKGALDRDPGCRQQGQACGYAHLAPGNIQVKHRSDHKDH